MRRNSSSATCAGMKILKRDLRSCEKNSAFAFVLRSWPSCADVQQAKFDSHNHAQPNMNQAIIANQTCQVMKDASTAILECKSWKSKLTRRGPNNYGSCFCFSCWLLLAVVFPIFYMNQPSSWGLLLKALVDDCDVYLSLDDLEKNHVSLEADVASGKYDDVIRAGSELSNNLIDYKNAAKKPRGQRPRLLRQEIRLSWAGAWELSNIRTTYLRIGEKNMCCVMLSWCNAFELPKFWMWNGGTFWHSFVGHVMMYTCIMGLGSECMDHYVQFGSCTWSKSILYINISRYKSFTNVYQTNVPCWGTAYVWTSRCCLKTHTTVGHGSWGLIHGQIDIIASWCAEWEK